MMYGLAENFLTNESRDDTDPETVPLNLFDISCIDRSRDFMQTLNQQDLIANDV